MVEQWKTFTLYQKTMLTIYAIIGLPMMPVCYVICWIVSAKRPNDLIAFLSMCMVMTMFDVLYIAAFYWALEK